MRRKRESEIEPTRLELASRGLPSGVSSSPMRSRRVLIFGALLLLGAVTARAAAEMAPLRVTYYYLPG